MTITIEKKLRDFDFWSGAADNAAKLTCNELDMLEILLEEENMDIDPWTETEINDLMWFDFESVCARLGLDYEEVMAREKE